MKPMLINGRFSSGHAREMIQVINPATGEILDEVPRGTGTDVDTAVAAAKAAFDGWRRMPAWERAGLLHEAANKMQAHEEELARLLVGRYATGSSGDGAAEPRSEYDFRDRAD